MFTFSIVYGLYYPEVIVLPVIVSNDIWRPKSNPQTHKNLFKTLKRLGAKRTDFLSLCLRMEHLNSIPIFTHFLNRLPDCISYTNYLPSIIILLIVKWSRTSVFVHTWNVSSYWNSQWPGLLVPWVFVIIPSYTPVVEILQTRVLI